MFAKKNIKQAVDCLCEIFTISLKERGVQVNSKLFFDHFIRPQLIRKKIEELAAFEWFIKCAQGVDFCYKAIEAYSIQPSLGAKRFKNLVHSGIRSMLIDPSLTQNILKTYPRIEKIMEGRFTPHHDYAYLENILQAAIEAPPSSQFSITVQNLEIYLDEIERIQNERPHVYTGEEQKRVVELNDRLQDSLRRYPFLKNVFQELLEMTVITDAEPLKQGIRSFYQADPPPFRLEKRKRCEFTISQEVHPQMSLTANSEEKLACTPWLSIFLTNEKTMETRSFQTPLPLCGSMSHTEACQALCLLEKMANPHSDFDTEYDRLQLDPALKERVRTQFTQWICSNLKEFGKALFDFNGTSARPPMSFVKEIPEMQTIFQNPEDGQRALAAARLKNIFFSGGKLSLLPPELAKQHPAIAYLSQEEISQSTQLLLNAGKKSLPITLCLGCLAELSLERAVVKLAGQNAIKLTVTIQRNQKKKSRTTLYPVNKRETCQHRLNALVKSGLFYRDLLLAKAESLDLVECG